MTGPASGESGAQLCGPRTLAAFALLPPLDALLGALLFPLAWWLTDQDGYRLRSSSDALVPFAVISGVSGLLVTIGGAVPVVLTLAQRQRLSLRNAVISGVLLGNAPFAVYLAFVLSFTIQHIAGGTLRDHLVPISSLMAAGARVIAVGSTMGVISALVFWTIGVRRS